MTDLPGISDRDAQLARRMTALGVREADLQESFVASSGPGGQNVNKVATCVVLVHRPTGVQVKCQATRQQGQNRLFARELLLDKIEAARRARTQAQQAEREKIRRQKRGRSRAAKQRNLANKAHHSAKKAERRWAGDE
jgi:protein subunit release factor B